MRQGARGRAIRGGSAKWSWADEAQGACTRPKEIQSFMSGCHPGMRSRRGGCCRVVSELAAIASAVPRRCQCRGSIRNSFKPKPARFGHGCVSLVRVSSIRLARRAPVDEQYFGVRGRRRCLRPKRCIVVIGAREQRQLGVHTQPLSLSRRRLGGSPCSTRRISGGQSRCCGAGEIAKECQHQRSAAGVASS